MGYREPKVYSVTMASGATLSSELDLGGWGWYKVNVDVTGAASEVRIQAAATREGTYRQVYHPPINSSTVGHNIYKIPSASSGGFAEIPAGFQFIKIETTAAVSNGATFTVICSD